MDTPNGISSEMRSRLLRGGQVVTMDGVAHEVGKWDLLIAHPPCTYLSNAATHSFSLRVTPAEKVVARWAERVKAAIFFRQMSPKSQLRTLWAS